MHILSILLFHLAYILWLEATGVQGVPIFGATIQSSNPGKSTGTHSAPASKTTPAGSKQLSWPFIDWLEKHKDISELTKTPIFWSGKVARSENDAIAWRAEDFANKNPKSPYFLAKDKGESIFDLVKQAGFHDASAHWKAQDDWTKVSQTFAHLVKPKSRKVNFVYYEPKKSQRSIWNDFEWPELLKNPHVDEVYAYKLETSSDGQTTMGVGQEIKKSGKGNVFKQAMDAAVGADKTSGSKGHLGTSKLSKAKGPVRSVQSAKFAKAGHQARL